MFSLQPPRRISTLPVYECSLQVGYQGPSGPVLSHSEPNSADAGRGAVRRRLQEPGRAQLGANGENVVPILDQPAPGDDVG